MSIVAWVVVLCLAWVGVNFAIMLVEWRREYRRIRNMGRDQRPWTGPPEPSFEELQAVVERRREAKR
jgi:hypothetical protein